MQADLTRAHAENEQLRKRLFEMEQERLRAGQPTVSASALLRMFLSEHRWATASSLLDEHGPHIIGIAEMEQGAALGWTPLHVAAHKQTPEWLLKRFAADAPQEPGRLFM